MTAKAVAFITHSPDGTHELGRRIGLAIPSGTIMMLYGDLGSGKTVFVQGLARGLSVPEEYYVTSPTYTLINEYPGRCPLYHIDLYRLSAASDFEDIGLDDALSGAGVAAIEWAERFEAELLSDYLAVHMTTTGEDQREIRVTGHGAAMADWVNELDEALPETVSPAGVVKERQWG